MKEEREREREREREKDKKNQKKKKERRREKKMDYNRLFTLFYPFCVTTVSFLLR